MNIHPDYYNIAQTHTHPHMLASMCVCKHTNPLVIALHVLKTPTSVPICLLCSHAYIQTGVDLTHTSTHTHILPQASSTASQQGYDHPARMIKLVRHQCSLRRVYVCVTECLCECVYVCVCVCFFFQCSLKPETELKWGEQRWASAREKLMAPFLFLWAEA